MRPKSLFIFVLSFLWMLSSLAREYYVDAGAGPGGDGSLKAPFRTIGEASARLKPGDVCLIAPGIYSESVRPAVSGTPGKPIVFRSLAPEGGVIVTGLDPVPASHWEKQNDGFFRAAIEGGLGHENQVFLGMKMLHEARWPNTGDDPLYPVLSVMEEGTTPEKIVDGDLPDLDWSGAGVWIHAPKYWSDWTTKVLSYEKGSLEIENVAPFPGPRRHVTRPGADYYIYGCKAALDTVNEWFYDEKESYLYVKPSRGRIAREPYYVKKRMLAFDLSGRSHIRVENLEIRASTIITDRSSCGIILDGLKIFHPYHTSETHSGNRGTIASGVMISGTRCEVRNCEIAWSAASGIVLGGKYNLVYNCYIHDTDYLGTYASCVTLRGKGNIISHCTLCRSGRAMIDYGGMQRALIQFCDMYHSGMLTSDTGLTYGNVIEGDGTEIRYNWLHDNLDSHLDMGLYYDHGTQNILSHHNVIWGVEYSGLQINHYAQYHLVYHNTVSAERFGFKSSWGNQYLPDLHGCRFFNNVFSAPASTTAGNYAWGRNVQNYSRLIDHKYLSADPECIDAGIVIPGINDGYRGEAPDLGAYEAGGEQWKAGHDFSDPPQLDTTRSAPLYRNMLGNAAFEHENHVYPWQASGEVRVERDRKGQGTPDTMTIRMGGASLQLGKESGVSQRISGLQPGAWYEFAAFVRAGHGTFVCLGERDPGGNEELSPFMEANAPRWNRLILRFKTEPGQTETTVFVRTSGDGGAVYLDDCGVVYLSPVAVK